MAYDAKAQKKYRDKSIQIAVCYRPTDIEDGKRLKQYLTDTNQTANAYIKALIKKDLDNKGIDYPKKEATENTDIEADKP